MYELNLLPVTKEFKTGFSSYSDYELEGLETFKVQEVPLSRIVCSTCEQLRIMKHGQTPTWEQRKRNPVRTSAFGSAHNLLLHLDIFRTHRAAKLPRCAIPGTGSAVTDPFNH